MYHQMTYLYDRIDEELEDAEEYIEHALKYKESAPEMASLLVKLSAEELGHASMLSNLAEQELTLKRKNGAAPDAAFAQVHDWLKCKFADRMASVRRMHDAFAGK